MDQIIDWLVLAPPAILQRGRQVTWRCVILSMMVLPLAPDAGLA